MIMILGMRYMYMKKYGCMNEWIFVHGIPFASPSEGREPKMKIKKETGKDRLSSPVQSLSTPKICGDALPCPAQRMSSRQVTGMSNCLHFAGRKRKKQNDVTAHTNVFYPHFLAGIGDLIAM